MKRKEFKEELMEVLYKSIDNMNEEDKLVLIKNLLIEYEKIKIIILKTKDNIGITRNWRLFLVMHQLRRIA
jgi:hypothetical protein